MGFVLDLVKGSEGEGIPASTMPSTFSTIALSCFVSLSLTVTVTPFQVMFRMVVFFRWASATACRSMSMLTTSMGSLSLTLSEGVLSTAIMTFFSLSC